MVAREDDRLHAEMSAKATPPRRATLWGGWLVGLWVACRLMLRRSFWVVAATPVALAVLWAYVEVGWAMWGWAVEDLPLGGR